MDIVPVVKNPNALWLQHFIEQSPKNMDERPL